MAYADPEKRLAADRRYKAKKRAERYGEGVGDQRGRHGNHARGSKNARWNAGRIRSTEGYVKLRVGKDHPLADPNGYAYEHLVVWASAGYPLPAAGEILHHKDEDKSNNRLDNLEKLPNPVHAAHHIAARRRDARGRLLPKSTA